MRKIKLELDTLAVQSFETTAVRGAHGTVVGLAAAPAPTQAAGSECGSAIDACPSARCVTLSPDECPTWFPEYCVFSADAACPSGLDC